MDWLFVAPIGLVITMILASFIMMKQYEIRKSWEEFVKKVDVVFYLMYRNKILHVVAAAIVYTQVAFLFAPVALGNPQGTYIVLIAEVVLFGASMLVWWKFFEIGDIVVLVN